MTGAESWSLGADPQPGRGQSLSDRAIGGDDLDRAVVGADGDRLGREQGDLGRRERQAGGTRDAHRLIRAVAELGQRLADRRRRGPYGGEPAVDVQTQLTSAQDHDAAAVVELGRRGRGQDVVGADADVSALQRTADGARAGVDGASLPVDGDGHGLVGGGPGGGAADHPGQDQCVQAQLCALAHSNLPDRLTAGTRRCGPRAPANTQGSDDGCGGGQPRAGAGSSASGGRSRQHNNEIPNRPRSPPHPGRATSRKARLPVAWTPAITDFGVLLRDVCH